MRRGMTEDQEKLVIDNLNLVPFVMRKYYGSSARLLSEDELVSAGNVGLVRAAQAFDPSRGVAFSTLAVPYIRSEIYRYVRANRSLMHIPVSALKKMSLEEMEKCSVASIDALDIQEKSQIRVMEDRSQNVEDHAILLVDIERALGRMKPNKQKIIRDYIGGKTMREIAEQQGCTWPRIQFIVSEFRKNMNGYGGKKK